MKRAARITVWQHGKCASDYSAGAPAGRIASYGNKIRRMLMKKLMFLMLILTMVSSAAFAGKVFEGYWEQTSVTKSTMPMQPEEETEKQVIHYKQGKMKIHDVDEGKVTIFRFDKELMWEIDLNRKSYSEVTFAGMQAQVDQAKESMKELQGELDAMSPEQRKMMEKMMGKKLKSMLGDDGGMQMSITAEYLGEKKTINGYACKKVQYYMNGEPFTTVWLTDKYYLEHDFMDVYHKMGMVKGEFSESVRKVRGFPIESDFKMKTGMGDIETRTTVTKIVTQSVPDSEFALPKGLKQSKKRMGF
jgi:hypothetical protein